MHLLGESSVTGIHLLPTHLKEIAYIWTEYAKEYYAQPPPEADSDDSGSRSSSGAEQCTVECSTPFPIAVESEEESSFFDAVVKFISSSR